MNSTPSGAGAEPLDHVVLPVAELGVARARLTALGFTVAPDGVHPFGTANCCVYLPDGTFLEPLAIGDAEQASASARGGNVFTARDAAYRRDVGNDGFSALVLATGDAGADHAAFAKAGFSAGRSSSSRGLSSMRRAASDTASFRLAFAADPRARRSFLFHLPAAQRAESRPQRAAKARQRRDAHRPDHRGRASKPADLADLLDAGAGAAKANAGREPRRHRLPNATIVAMTPAAIEAEFGIEIGGMPSPRLVAHRLRRRRSVGSRSLLQIRPDRLCHAPTPPGRAAGGRAGRYSSHSRF